MEDTETTKLLYTSPTGDWIVCKQKNLWLQNIDAVEFYLVCKYEKFNKLVSDAFPRQWTDYTPMYFNEKIENAFAWLRSHNLISKDEEKFQIARLTTCRETFLDTIVQTLLNTDSKNLGTSASVGSDEK